jgi:uncharacterized protein YggE
VDREIVVRGEGEVRVMPDRATVQVLVDGEGSDRNDAYEAAARVAQTVDQVLAANADAIERVTTTALVVQPRTRWKKGETIRTGWRAYRNSIVEIRGLDRVGDLLAQIATGGGSISGLSWDLDRASPAYDQARLEAGRDARHRAALYADSLGVRLGALAWVAEPGLRVPGPHSGNALYAAAARPLSASLDEETIDVSPEEITVTVVIEAAFQLQHE